MYGDVPLPLPLAPGDTLHPSPPPALCSWGYVGGNLANVGDDTEELCAELSRADCSAYDESTDGDSRWL